ncbi:hypothetical protein K227x_12200 [Rubripirellula lacrimiformis]|uniref:Uncharacterized protein n=1 Tax=Rubripirellula lacrimiformis TaxID=1930273 RepID=A0A517N6U8_9BACT|nr:hypothetical protein K227x_12200 [Rubripirellula lacrimiformis]
MAFGVSGGIQVERISNRHPKKAESFQTTSLTFINSELRFCEAIPFAMSALGMRCLGCVIAGSASLRSLIRPTHLYSGAGDLRPTMRVIASIKS